MKTSGYPVRQLLSTTPRAPYARILPATAREFLP